jgi:hypothetical protein
LYIYGDYVQVCTKSSISRMGSFLKELLVIESAIDCSIAWVGEARLLTALLIPIFLVNSWGGSNERRI